MAIAFERATPADAPALLGAQIRAFHHDARLYPGIAIGGPPGYDSLDALRADLDHEDYYKIIGDGQIIGGIVVFDRGGGHVHLDRIYLDPDYQNLGIGTQAMHFLEATYPATTWTLDTPRWAVRNRHFYEKLGYRNVGEFEADGITPVSYEKHLPR